MKVINRRVSMGYKVGVVGATGMVGREMLKVLEQRDFPVDEIRLLASERSKGRRLSFRGQEIEVEVLSPEGFDGLDFALFSAGGSISKEYAPIAAKKGVVVIDNSSAWRMDPDVPLVVPEVNPEDAFKHKGIIANPNCSTIQMVVVLKPLADKYGIRRVVVSTYQSVSGWGKAAVDQLWEELRFILENCDKCPAEELKAKLRSAEGLSRVLAHPIAFNALPHIDVFHDEGYTKEEWKMINETKKIMHLPDIEVSPTCVRVPVLKTHSEAVNVELKEKFSSLDEVMQVLSSAKGVTVLDDPDNDVYPLALDMAGEDDVFVGRIRRDFTVESGLNLWIVADNLRKGAALNAVQIAELLISS